MTSIRSERIRRFECCFHDSFTLPGTSSYLVPPRITVPGPIRHFVDPPKPGSLLHPPPCEPSQRLFVPTAMREWALTALCQDSPWKILSVIAAIHSPPTTQFVQNSFCLV